MQGTGSVRDLKEAAALSPELAALLVDVYDSCSVAA